MPLAAGEFDTRVRLERRPIVADDGYGNTRGAWAPLASRWARWRPEYGRERIAAGRLEEMRPGVLVVSTCSVTRSLSTDDRVVFTSGPEAGAIGNIRSVSRGAAEVEIVIDLGVAT